MWCDGRAQGAGEKLCSTEQDTYLKVLQVVLELDLHRVAVVILYQRGQAQHRDR